MQILQPPFQGLLKPCLLPGPYAVCHSSILRTCLLGVRSQEDRDSDKIRKRGKRSGHVTKSSN